MSLYAGASAFIPIAFSFAGIPNGLIKAPILGHATGLLGYQLPPSGRQTPPLSSASSPPLSIVCAWHTVTFLPFLSFHRLDHLIAPPMTGHSPFYRAHVPNTTQPNIATRVCQPQKHNEDKATPYPEQLVVTIDKMSTVRETVWHTSND